MDLRDKKVLVIGGGKSGIAASRFLAIKGAEVTLNDAADINHLQELEKDGVRLAGGGHLPELFRDKDLIVLSPGVPADTHPICALIDRAVAGGAEAISEVELASRFIRAPIIAVAGTNGKSTTTMLIGEMLKAGGRKVFVGGNLGTPLSQYLVDGEDAELIVLEVSSFQLDMIESFRPFISIMLNITPDHLDRYKSMGAYINAKSRLFANQAPEDYAILNMEDEITAKISTQIRARIIPFGVRGCHPGGVYVGDECIMSDIEGLQARIEVPHSVSAWLQTENIMAASAASLVCGMPEEVISMAIRDFRGLPHRMELVGEICGVRFVDDSKATNVGAAVNSLESLGRVVLIAGGKDKGGSYEPLRTALKGKGKGVVLIGEAAARIKRELGGEADVFIASNMEDAVEHAWHIAEDGDTVLLSPACASFDMFRNYAERGMAFRGAAQRIIERVSREEVSLAG